MHPAQQRPETELSDAELVELTRGGDRDAYAELWRRHARAGLTVARSLTSSFDADDLIAESYAKIYAAIGRGNGPTSSFRAYLFTTVRSVAASWGRARRETPIEDIEAVEDPAFGEAATMDALDRSLTAQAFRSLPSRWQEVLWYCEVEAMKPAEVAPLLGMSANAVAALAYRAREGLRQAWVQAHLASVPEDSECRWTTERLGAHARGGLSKRDTAKVEAHLAGCARCTVVAAEAHEVGSRLALVLLPLTVGVGATAAYTAWIQSGANAVPYALGSAGAALPATAVPASAVAASAGAAGTTTGRTGGGAAGGGGSAGTVAGIAAAGVLVAAAIAGALVLGPQLFGGPVAAETSARTPAASVPQPSAPEPAAPPPPAVLLPPPAGAPQQPVPVAAPAVPPPAATPAPPATPATPAPAPTTPSTPTPPAPPAPAAPVLLAPAAGTTTAARTIDAAGTGRPGATVAIAAGATRLVSARVGADGSWSAAVPIDGLGDGAWTLSVVQSAAGRISTAATVRLVIDRTALPPVLTAVDTGDGADTGLLAPIVSGTAEPGATVQVLDGGAVQATVTADADGRWATGQLTGVRPSFSLSALQTDPLGNVSGLSASVAGSVRVPTASAQVTGTAIALTVTGLPGRTVLVIADGAETGYRLDLGPDGGTTGYYQWTAPGDHRIGAAYTSGERRGLVAAVPITIG